MNKTAIILFLLFLFCSLKNFSQPLHDRVVFVSVKTIIPDSLIEEQTFVSSLASTIEEWMKAKQPAKTVLGYTQQNRAVEAYYFPGTSNKKALVIGGMHGSELSSIEVAKKLIGLLSDSVLSYYNVIIVPVLFPDNAEKAIIAAGKQKTNPGRYTTEHSVDPNRQMPELGRPFRYGNPVDMYGRIIERENQLLLQLIQDYAPSRIANLHAIKDIAKAGVYADPRTDCNGYALGFESDSSLAVSMALFIQNKGGEIPGNQLLQTPTALYYQDPEVAPAGSVQQRNLHGTALPGNRGYGVSLGGWASTAVCDEAFKRDAARLITVEFPGYKPSSFYKGKEKEARALNVQLYAMALKEIFLGENYSE